MLNFKSSLLLATAMAHIANTFPAEQQRDKPRKGVGKTKRQARKQERRNRQKKRKK